MELHRLSLLGTVVVVVAATGCGGGNGAGRAGGKATTTASTTSSVASSGSMKTVTIDESEFTLSPSSVKLAKPGNYTFKLVNKGTVSHALEIQGSGVNAKSGAIAPGKSTTLQVDFKDKGTFQMFCPIDGHRQQGMQGKITVGVAAAAGGAGTTTQTSTTQTSTGGRYGY